MKVKRKTADFLCAFAVFSIVLLSIALLTNESFFEGAVMWDGNENVLTLFGTEFVFDSNLPKAARTLLSFNDRVFGRDFSTVVGGAARFFAEYVRDGAVLVYSLAKAAVGAA